MSIYTHIHLKNKIKPKVLSIFKMLVYALNYYGLHEVGCSLIVIRGNFSLASRDWQRSTTARAWPCPPSFWDLRVPQQNETYALATWQSFSRSCLMAWVAATGCGNRTYLGTETELYIWQESGLTFALFAVAIFLPSFLRDMPFLKAL